LALGDEKRDEQEELLGSSDPTTKPKRPGEFTRFFFGMELGKTQTGESPQTNPVSGPPPLTDQPQGSLNADLPPRGLNEDHPLAEHGVHEPDAGTLSDLFSQVPLKPINPQSDTFSRLFNNQFESQQAPLPSTEFPVTGSVGRPAPANTQHLSPEFPAAQQKDVNLEESNSGSVPFGTSPQNVRGQKATRLFSPQSATDPLVSMSGPSAFTRVIDASAQRSAAEGTEHNHAAQNNPPPATPASASPPVMPSWPVASVPSPIYPPVYVPQQSVSVPMPSVSPVGWSQTPSFPTVSSSSLPQLQTSPTTTEQRWIAYLPLIIGLNILLFLTSILILIFALSR